MSQAKVNRRSFLKTTAAGATALSLTAASAGRVLGANERIGVGFLGVGGRCQEHLQILNKFKQENKGAAPVAVCDVWDGNKEVGRGLYPSAEKVGLKADDKEHVTKDYRRVLDLKDVDVVCIATPDHWHAKMSIDAAAAGKDVYCEKPMTKTIDEAHAVVDAMKKYNRVMSVGVQSMADPTWRMANEMIRDGRIGHVAQAQTSYYRNYIGGQWRYYKITKDMNPKTIDWDMFLGNQFHVISGVPLAPKMDFDRAVYGQWRCYWPFGGGMFTDLFVHQTTHMIAAMGVRYPARVVGAGGIYLEYDERDVPDVATVVRLRRGLPAHRHRNDDQRPPHRGGHSRPTGQHPLREQGSRQDGSRQAGLRVRHGDPAPGIEERCRRPQAAGKHARSIHRRRAKRERHRSTLGQLPGMRPLPQAQHVQHTRAGRRRLHDGQLGRAKLPQRQRPVLG